MLSWEQLVDEERRRQDAKWGQQDTTPEWWLTYIVEELGEVAKAILHTFGNDPNPTAKGNLLEELIQVAALAKAMYESGVRNGWIK